MPRLLTEIAVVSRFRAAVSCHGFVPRFRALTQVNTGNPRHAKNHNNRLDVEARGACFKWAGYGHTHAVTVTVAPAELCACFVASCRDRRAAKG